MKNQNIYHLRDNLRKLVSECDSVTHAATELGINRQQLNKYLSGVTTPSLRSLQHISAYFHVTVESMFLSPEAFNASRNMAVPLDSLNSVRSDELDRTFAAAKRYQDILRNHCGVYHVLARPSMMKGAVARYLMKIYQQDGLTYATRIETYVPINALFKDPRSVRKFHSVVMFASGKLIMISSFSGARITFSIIYPDEYPEYGFLQGHALFSYDAGARAIYSTPFILNRLRVGSVRRQDILSCGVFAFDDPSISDIERAMLLELDFS